MKFKWMPLKPKLAHFCEFFYNNELEMTFFLKSRDAINLSDKIVLSGTTKNTIHFGKSVFC